MLLSLTFAGALAAWEKAVHMLPYYNTLSGRRQSLPNPQVLWTHLYQLSYIAYPPVSLATQEMSSTTGTVRVVHVGTFCL